MPVSKKKNRKQAELLLQKLAEFGPKYGKWIAHLMKATGVTPARHHLLCKLKHEGPKKMSELGKAMDVSATNVTILVDGLEKDGLVQRHADPNDRRSTWIQLTEKAELEVPFDSIEALDPIVDMFSQQFHDKELEVFCEFVDRLLRSLPK
ncbi:putative Transcriptional regulator, MarR family [Leptospira ryugenii]|uniref:Putative Transcriptional regulator, MarR family n=1 Tax=Leptospira ryugenii TaxID=1917863 RepID=A0A2P2DZS7_9LEPT|nr:MarR family transcriptional regulator [Leptospira ryugenii]GBF50120.1 putative Transcriptional regulator, MarR family [Leptospira ryugenii]